MKGRLPLFVLLASALTFLASLFLPWRETTFLPVSGEDIQGLLTLFEGGSVNGWVGISGDVAVLLVVAIVLSTIVTLRRPQLAARLPIGGLGVALGYFAVAVAAEVHLLSQEIGTGFTGRPPTTHHTSWAHGFYLGLAAAGIAALSGLAYRRTQPLGIRGAADAVAGLLGLALLVSFLLPWFGFPGPGTPSTRGIESAAAAIVALGLILGAGWLHGEAGRRWRLPLAIAIAILTGGAASAVGLLGVQRYGAWIGVGCAVSLVAVEAVRAWPVRLPGLPHGLAAVRMAAAGLIIVALFLPWQEIRGAVGVNGQVTDGWYSVTGAAAGSLCLLLLAASVLPALETYVLDLVVAVVIFVSALGTAFRENSPFFGIGYGAFVGFAAAGILLVTALVSLRPRQVDRGRALARAAPLAASVLCVAALVVPLWFLLPQNWTFQSFGLYGSLAVPGVLLALYLVRLWASRVRGPARTGHRLTIVPLTLLTLASLELIRFRDSSVVMWGAVIVVGLCLLLALFGWLEENRGLGRVRVPEEIWRVDRLPEPES